MSVHHGCLLALAFAVGAGCAAAPPQPAAAPDDGSARMILTWHEALPDDAASIARFEAEASRLAGVAVRRLATVSERVSAISIDCADAPACRDAAARLRADRRVVDLLTDSRRGSHRTQSPHTY